jgi:hypothetical protein
MKKVSEKRNQMGSIVSGELIVHALNADDFLHFINNPILYQMFKKQFRQYFYIKSESVTMYLGNRVTVYRSKQNVALDQTEFINQLLDKFGKKESTPVQTRMVARLSADSAGEKQDAKDHELYHTIAGSVLYLGCWSRPTAPLAEWLRRKWGPVL